MRLTDKFSRVAAGAPFEPGTTTDFVFPATVPCSATPSTGTGAQCAVSTSLNAIVPAAFVEGGRTIVQLGQVRVLDGGPDGVASSADNDPFAVQGIFVP